MYNSAFIMFFIPSDRYLFLKQCTFSFETNNLLDSFKGGPEGYESFFSAFSGKETGAFQSTVRVDFNEFSPVCRAQSTEKRPLGKWLKYSTSPAFWNSMIE